MSAAIREQIGERVRAARKARGLTQAELAKLCDVGQSSIASIENGRTGPGLGLRQKLEAAMGVGLLGLPSLLGAPGARPRSTITFHRRDEVAAGFFDRQEVPDAR